MSTLKLLNFPQKLLLGVILGALLIHGLSISAKVGQTVDEAYYSGIGYPAVRHQSYDFIREHPPFLMQLGAISLLFAQPTFPIDNPVYLEGHPDRDVSKTGAKFLYQSGNNPKQILFLQRIPIVLLMVLLGALIFLWASELFGPAGGFISLVLYAFSPNILANGTLFTTDMGVSVFLFAIFYGVYRFSKQGGIKALYFLGACCGLALVSKISALIGLILVPALILLMIWLEPQALNSIKELKQKRLWAILALLLFVFSVGQKIMSVALGPIALTLLYITWLRDFLFQQKWQKIFAWLVFISGWIACIVSAVLLYEKLGPRLPTLALGWIALAAITSLGFLRLKRSELLDFSVLAICIIFATAFFVITFTYVDFIKSYLRFNPFDHFVFAFMLSLTHTQSAHTGCVEGSFITCDWRYFFSTMAVKTPVIGLGFMIIGTFASLLSKVRLFDKVLFLALPLLFLFVASFLSQIYIGVRHVLPIYPFLFLLAGGVALLLRSKLSKVACGLLLAVYAINLSAISPNYLSFLNKIVGGEAGAALVTDSSFNWGQDNEALALWAKENKVNHLYILSSAGNGNIYDYHGLSWSYIEDAVTDGIASGTYAIDIALFQAALKKGVGPFHKLKPHAKVGSTYYIFKVSS